MSGRATGLLLVISAPSGAGKTTVCQNLLEADSKLARATTCTTRQAREGEVNGIDYYFLSEEEFNAKVAAGEFLEHAEVYGRCYGTLKSEVQRHLGDGRNVLLNIDVQGAALLRGLAAEEAWLQNALVTVFLTPDNWEELERRLRSRGSDPEEVIEDRLKTAATELEASSEFDYIVLSQSMDDDRRRIQVILEAEGMNRTRNQVPEALTQAAARRRACE